LLQLDLVQVLGILALLGRARSLYLMHDRAVEVPLLVHEFLGVVHLAGIS
jgi:hypothetical protein